MYLFAIGRIIKVIIGPSKEELLWGKLKEVTQLLLFSLESNKEWVVLQCDEGCQLDLDDLPHKTKDDVLSLVDDKVGSDIDNDTSDGFG